MEFPAAPGPKDHCPDRQTRMHWSSLATHRRALRAPSRARTRSPHSPPRQRRSSRHRCHGLGVASYRRPRVQGLSLPSWRLRRAATSRASRMTLERSELEPRSLLTFCGARPSSRHRSSAVRSLRDAGMLCPRRASASAAHRQIYPPPYDARADPNRSYPHRSCVRYRPAPCATPTRGRSPVAPLAGRAGPGARTPRAYSRQELTAPHSHVVCLSGVPGQHLAAPPADPGSGLAPANALARWCLPPARPASLNHSPRAIQRPLL